MQKERSLLPQHPDAAEPNEANDGSLELFGAHFFEYFAT